MSCTLNSKWFKISDHWQVTRQSIVVTMHESKTLWWTTTSEALPHSPHWPKTTSIGTEIQ